MADQQALHAFSQWVAGCSGDEKQEAQTFVQKLLTAWGWEDASEAGVSFEHRIPKGGVGGGMGYADALIPGRVLIEMKQRGEPLQKHLPQLVRYWFKLAPLPTYAILCNFDEFWVYDFNIQSDEPVEKLQTAQLAERWSGLAFFSKQPQTPLFGNNQVVVTEKQAAAMGSLFRELKQQAAKTGQFTDQQAQRFVLQCVLCMFAEDRDMLPDRQFSLALETCREKGESTYDVLGGLFNAMNTPGVTAGGRFKGTPYFNGGLFSEIPQIDLSPEQLTLLVDSAREDWRLVRPSIFGNIFEASSDDATRHAHGQHFTSEVDMLQIIRPTIVEPWEERIAKASTFAELEGLRQALMQYRVCDPACGSGNFLYMGYNALKDLEVSILRRIEEKRTAKKEKDQFLLGLVTPAQFYGMDTSPFAVELARVTLMIARKVANDRLGLTEQDLPLDNLDNNIRVADALFTPWPEADAYVGNPPFLGGKHMRLNLGDEYVERVFKRFPEVRDSVDFCTYWFRLAQENLKPDGRAGLVATNSIRHGKSRRASLDYIRDNGGHIHSAISTQPWSGDANVHVSIVNWSQEAAGGFRLDGEAVHSINTSLRSSVDVSEAVRLQTNKGFCFQGVIPVGKGFNVEPEIAQTWIEADPRNAEVVKPFSMGTNLAKRPLGQPDRWIIDFADLPLEAAEMFSEPFLQVKEQVRPQRMENRRETTRVNWWRYGEKRPAMREALEPLGGFFAVPEVSKWAVFLPCQPNWLCGNKNKVVASEDFYVLALLTSSVHRQWMHAQKGTLKGDIAYTHDTIFETFPFPQIVAPELVQKIRQAMSNLNDYRNELMVAKNWGITDIYNAYFHEPASQLAKLHKALDALVLKAYGWSAKDDLLANLLDLNLELAELEAEGQAVVGPWDPNLK
jgi:hypothetical protein